MGRAVHYLVWTDFGPKPGLDRSGPEWFGPVHGPVV